MKKQRVYTAGMEDVDRVLEHLTDEHKKARRAEWLREHYSKISKQKGGSDEDKRKS